jgi:acyl dehydratase
MDAPRAADLTPTESWFEDFPVGRRIRHARGTTIGEVESQLLTKLMMNSAQSHWNEHAAAKTPFGRRVVFGLLTASCVIGLTTQDTAEHALAEIGLSAMRFRRPVHLGDSVYAYSEVLETRDAEREDAGIVRFKHWGLNQDREVVFEAEREVLIRRRPAGAGA